MISYDSSRLVRAQAAVLLSLTPHKSVHSLLIIVQVSGNTRALGSSQAKLLAPVQQLAGSYVAAVQPHGSPHGLLVCTPVSSQQTRPFIDAEQQLPLPTALHSLHVLTGSSGSSTGCAAVVLADGTVGSADFEDLTVKQCSSGGASSNTAAGRGRAAHGAALCSASTDTLLAVAKQSAGASEVTVDVYTAAASTAGSEVDITQPAAAAAASGSRLRQINTFTVSCPSADRKLLGISVSSSSLLAMQWRDGSVTVYHSNLLQLSSQADHVATFALPDVLSKAALAAADQQGSRKRRTGESAGASQLVCAAVTDTHLLLVAVQSATEAVYTVLDSHFGCCLASGSVTLPGTAADSGHSSQLQLLRLPHHAAAPAALLAAGRVFLLHVQLPKADLAGLVFRLAVASSPTAAQAVTSRQQINLLAIAAAVSSNSGNAGAGAAQQQQQCVLQQLPAQQEQQHTMAAGAQPTAVAAAAERLAAVVSHQPVPAEELQQIAEQLCAALLQQQQSTEHPAGSRSRQQDQEQPLPSFAAAVLVSQRLLGQGLAALAEAEAWQLLGQLHSLQPLLSLGPCPGLLLALAAGQQYTLLRQVVLAAQDIPAESLVQAMQHLLSPPGPEEAASQQQEAAAMRAAAEAAVQAAEAATAAGDAVAAGPLVVMARRAAAAVDGFSASELLLHVLLAAHVDTVEAQAALAALPTPAVLRLLKVLHKWVTRYSASPLREASSCPSWEAAGLVGGQWSSSQAQALLQTPSWGQVLEWTRLVLDAHLTRLAMLPAAGRLLQQMQAVLQPEVGASSRLVRLKGVVDHMAGGGPLPAVAEAANSEYTLELLDLRVAGR